MQFALFVLTAWMWVGGTFGDFGLSHDAPSNGHQPSDLVLADGGTSAPPPPGP